MIDIFGGIPSYLLFFIAALLAFVLRGNLRNIVLLSAPVISGALLWQMGQGGEIIQTFQILGYELTPFRSDKLSLLFGYLFHIAAFMAILYAIHVKDTAQHVSALIYAGSAVGAVFAGDYLSLFVFLEIMAVSSAFLVWARGTSSALRAGMRYLIIQVISGVLLFAGALYVLRDTGSLGIVPLDLQSTAGFLIFLAIGIKAAFPLLHNWVTDAYPQATPTGAVFLCIFTTKTAVYLLARGFPGEEVLIYIGAVMAVFPLFLAMIENDLRRVLAYALINQVGFMVCAIGIGTTLAINGAVATAFNHVIYKSLLFMALGAVMHVTGRTTVSALGGLYKSMPKTAALYIIGALAISFPLFCGFVSKAVVMSAVMKGGYDWLWPILLFAAGGAFVVAGLKIPYAAFFAENKEAPQGQEAPRNMLAAMGLAALLCIAIGVNPQALYSLLPYEIDYSPYDVTHVLTQLQLLFFITLAFFWCKKLGLYPVAMRGVTLDVDWIYRKLFPCFIHGILNIIRPLYAFGERCLIGGLSRAIIAPLIRKHGPAGILAKTWPIGSMVLWVAVLLGFYLILYYFMER